MTILKVGGTQASRDYLITFNLEEGKITVTQTVVEEVKGAGGFLYCNSSQSKARDACGLCTVV